MTSRRSFEACDKIEAGAVTALAAVTRPPAESNSDSLERFGGSGVLWLPAEG